jgi:hypothetical protein
MYRKLTPNDIEHLRAEIAKDPYHKDKKYFDKNFTDDRGKTLVFEDNEGVVFYATFKREIEITIQFCEVDKKRIRNVFTTHMEEIADGFRKAGFTAMRYWTTNPALAWFLRRFGFKKEEFQRKEL